MKLTAPLLLALLSWLPLVNCAPSPDPGATGARHSGDVPEADGWRAEVVVTGLEHPWSIAWLPDGSALVTERPGRLRIIRAGALDPTPIAGTPEVLAHGQGGLLDVSLHPDFANNRLIYLTYAAGTKDANRTTLARARFDGTRLNDLDVIFKNAETKNDGQHFGSRILWLADRSLLLSIGDGGNPPIAFAGENIRNQAQRLGTHFGKILRLTADGQPHPDNPFIGRPGARPEIHTFGHRNIQGMALDPASGRVWANEHGSRGGDELNLIEPGQNYGWPAVTYSKEYWGPSISDEASRPGIPEPKIAWTPSKAPSGLAFYTGDRYPRWKGDLFSGSLKFGQIRRIDLDGEQVIGEEKLTIGSRVRDVRQGPDGYLYVLTDQDNGVLLRILPTDG
ncbi:PQQ-dependent sugar dehydrogenase [uncultured Thiocystis sp.]|uniref:PQQ-dependent sugar dehydrogenase n=1 Tax=uncultured Thiocystis sp. TaxID=1202134 RepID=UPI0025D2D264|nr:PQQ-dependent sugar dehydrogenase [uncultured Thiocystis sp.]